MKRTPQEAQGTPAAPAKPRGRRPAPKEAAEAGRVWTGERVTVGEGHPAPPETPSSPPVAVIPAGEAKPVPAEGEPHWYVVHAYSGHEEKVRNNLMKRVDSKTSSRSRTASAVTSPSGPSPATSWST
jgi:hypothetical protein